MYALIATQRSGTNMLRRILASNPMVLSLPEVFNDSYDAAHCIPNGKYYEQYFLERVSENIENALPKYRKENVRKYLKQLSKLSDKDDLTAIVDIKYNSLHHAEGTWSNPASPPVMMRIMKGQNFPVIHLRRENLVGVAISLMRANATQQYMASSSDSVKTTAFRVDPEILLHSLKQHETKQACVSNWLKDLNIPCLDITYESLFVDGPGSAFDPSIFRKIAEFMDIDYTKLILKSATKRLSSATYREEIENFDEVEEVLRETPYHAAFIA